MERRSKQTIRLNKSARHLTGAAEDELVRTTQTIYMNRTTLFSYTRPVRFTLATLVSMVFVGLQAADRPPARAPMLRAVDLDVNEAQELDLSNGTKVRIKLLRLDETRDVLRDAVRQARVQICLLYTSPSPRDS